MTSQRRPGRMRTWLIALVSGVIGVAVFALTWANTGVPSVSCLDTITVEVSGACVAPRQSYLPAVPFGIVASAVVAVALVKITRSQRASITDVYAGELR